MDLANYTQTEASHKTMLMKKSICVPFLVGGGSGSDAQSASYRDNMIKLNSMISHTFF